MRIYRSAENEVTIEGYVNAVERNSKPLFERGMRFVERIAAGAFAKAIRKAPVVSVLLNHNPNRELGNTNGTLELEEDNIGLKARFTTSDPEVVADANNGDLVGWSFGYRDVPGGTEQLFDAETGLPLRKVNDLELFEVSILNRKKTPAYAGTLVNVREDGSEDKTEVFFAPETDDEAEAKETPAEDKPEEVAEEITEERAEAEATPEEEPHEEAPEVKEVTSEYFASYKNMIAEMKK